MLFDSQIPISLSLSSLCSLMIIPAECRHLGLFVMVEVYHSVRLRRAASHELMMNAGRDRKREGSYREATQRWTGEQERESEINLGY